MDVKVILVDLDNTTLDFNGEKAKRHHPKHCPFPQGEPGFYRELPALPGAVEAIALLDADPRYEVHFCTAPSVDIRNVRCWSEKMESIVATFGEEFYYRTTITFDKSRVIGDYLVDDLPAGRGQEKFGGELLVFGSETFKDWQAVLDHFGIDADLGLAA